jgi:hypothetical protein
MQPFMSKARLRQQFDTVDEMLGGDDRLYHEANASSEAYWEFKKLQIKLTPKEAVVDHGLTEGMEAWVERLDAANRATTIEGSATEVVPYAPHQVRK